MNTFKGLRNRGAWLLLALCLALLVASPYAIGKVSGVRTAPAIVGADGPTVPNHLNPLPPPPVEDFCSWIWGPPCVAQKPAPAPLNRKNTASTPSPFKLHNVSYEKGSSSQYPEPTSPGPVISTEDYVECHWEWHYEYYGGPFFYVWREEVCRVYPTDPGINT